MENKNEKQNNKISEFIDKMKSVFERHGKIIIPVAICVIVVIVAICVMSITTKKKIDETVAGNGGVVDESLLQEPLEKDAHEELNNFMSMFYQALADGDIDTIMSLKDYTNDEDRITYQEKSQYIEAYTNLVCYSKKGLEEGSYFVYEYYDVKFYDIEATAPGMNTWYVYTAEDGSFKIDGDMDEAITASLMLVTSTDDVVDLFNSVDAKYNEAVASDESLKAFLDEIRDQIRMSVGVALASLEDSTEEETQTETEEVTEQTEEQESEEQTEDVQVNELVRTTDVVNVRKSDSENADKLGKTVVGQELTRLEAKANGWSKVIFEDQEAYIKSEYLEVISSEEPEADDGDAAEVTEVTEGASMTAQTNVNVRNAANTDADAIGVAQAGQSYTVVESLSDGWMKIQYNGQIGFVKSEYFR